MPGAVDGQAREAQEPPALTDGGGAMHQDQGAQVDDVPVVDEAVDESDDAPAEAPPIEGREVAAPADALAEPLGSPAQAQGPTDVRKRPPPLCAKRVRLLAVSAVTDSTALASTPAEPV